MWGGGSPRPSLFLLPFISLTPSKIADKDIGTFSQSKMFTTCTLTRSTDVGVGRNQASAEWKGLKSRYYRDVHVALIEVFSIKVSDALIW